MSKKMDKQMNGKKAAKKPKSSSTASIATIEKMVDAGEDVTRFFTKGHMVYPPTTATKSKSTTKTKRT